MSDHNLFAHSKIKFQTPTSTGDDVKEWVGLTGAGGVVLGALPWIVPKVFYAIKYFRLKPSGLSMDEFTQAMVDNERK